MKRLLDNPKVQEAGALRFLDLQISGPTELMPGLICESAGGHTEGSMNVIVKTAEGVATICGDVLYDINDQLVEPLREISDMEPRVTGNHGTTKTSGEGCDQESRRLVAFRAAGPRSAGANRGRAGGRPPAGRGARPHRPILAAAQLVPGVTQGACR
jgi:hypothetical protein